MPDSIAPALTSASGYKIGDTIVCEACEQSFSDDAAFRAHAVTAHPRSHGFTWEDADLVEVCGRYGGNPDWTLSPEKLDALLSLARRIAALLPPRQGA